MIQVGIIGTGFIGPAHIEAIRRLGFVEVVALCDADLADAQQKARQLGVPHAYASVEALLAHPGLQVVHNCTQKLTAKSCGPESICFRKNRCA